MYTRDLLELDQCRREGQVNVPRELSLSPSPLQWREWEDCLRGRSDLRFRRYIMEGLQQGFRIGFQYWTHECKKSKANMSSAREHSEVVRSNLVEECVQGRALGPLYPGAWEDLHISKFRVIGLPPFSLQYPQN